MSANVPTASARGVLLAVLAAGSAGCMSDQTRNMADTCNQLLAQANPEDARTFIADAQQHLAALEKPGNGLTRYLRDLQDPDAEQYKPALAQCLWLLKSRQP